MTKHRRRSVSSSSSESQSFRILYSILFQHDRSSEPTEINRKALLYVSRYLRRAYRKIARERKGRGKRVLRGSIFVPASLFSRLEWVSRCQGASRELGEFIFTIEYLRRNKTCSTRVKPILARVVFV